MSDEPVRAPLARRDFLVRGGAIAGTVVAGCAHRSMAPVEPSPGADAPASAAAPPQARIRSYRRLGRTGFQVSDLGFGCTRMIGDPEVVRYACDRGVNLIDTAEGYGNGNAERTIGQALPHLDRKKIFIVTKLKLTPEESEQSIVERLGRCLERLRTDRVEALYMHAVTTAAEVKHPGFHAAVRRLKAAGRVKHAGLSCHGPRGQGDTIDQVCLAAVEDGRFDLLLFVYNFVNSGPGRRVLAACQARQIGTTLMKTKPARLKLEPFDPEQPSEEHARLLAIMERNGSSREEAVARMQETLARQQAEAEQNRATIDGFIARHGVRTEEQLARKSVQWALASPAVGSALIAFTDFESVDAILPVSGLRLAASEAEELEDWARAFGSQYCRHGCAACAAACPHGVPVSTVMRYAYYARQGAERQAILKYAALAGADASPCLSCPAPCSSACPHRLDVRAQLLTAHQLLGVA